MADVAIRAEGLGKEYRIGVAPEPYGTLRESLVRAVRRPLDRIRSGAGTPTEGDASFWAIRDIAFEVRRGEVIGIVGRNGAGKSTLLKVLSRITEPTAGEADVFGRVGSLLEVGTGFHPELTGRDNVFLNGAILGMSRRYMQSRFDEIVDFSGVEQFLDTPVKRYSSGMYLRLAFAVAAYMEPEVLIVDEVLAVGDAEFQRKCLGKMDEIAATGRTVLFVSHNLAAVQRLCTRALLLEGGRLRLDAPPAEVIAAYSDAGGSSDEFSDARRLHRSEEVTVRDGWTQRNGAPERVFKYGDTLEVMLQMRVSARQRFSVELVLRDQDQVPIAFFASGVQHRMEFDAEPGDVVVRVQIPSLPLAEGRYTLDVAAAETGRRFLDYLESALRFEVELSDPEGTGLRYLQNGKGSVYIHSGFAVADGPATPIHA